MQIPFNASRRAVLASALLATASGRVLAQQALVEGTNYLRLKNPQPVDTGKKIEVLYFFSFGCPHCRDFHPVLEAWLPKVPADVEFRRVPVDFGRDQWAVLGKVLYTLEALGMDEKVYGEVFAAVHDKKLPIYTDKGFFDWAASKGWDRKKVEDTFNSFGVASKMNRARALAKNYNIQSIPVVFVDGKFQVAASQVGSHANMPAAIEQLVAKARAERPKA